MRLFLIISFSFLLFPAKSQNPAEHPDKSGLSKYTGKYESNGMILQVARKDSALVLLVPGAPPQNMIATGVGQFKTDAFSDENFLFAEKHGKIETMTSNRPGQALEFKKVSDTTDDFNKGDSLLVLKKSTQHFSYLYSGIDSINVDRIANTLESSYNRILNDLKVKKMPVTIVRIYPDLASFHQGINFPNAPDNVQATAFGKDDFRMVSPSKADMDTFMFTKGVVHEFTHCVHLNIDYSPNNPRWLWEGLAMFEAEWFFDPREIDIIKNKDFPGLAALGNGMEYMLGYTIIEAIRDIWGMDTVVSLIRNRGNVQTLLGITESQFEEKIFEHIYKKYIKS